MPTFADQQLLEAAKTGDAKGVEQALRDGAEVDLKADYNDTALNQAALWGHTEVARLLVEAGADLENKGGADMTPLMNAASRGHMEIVQLLLEKGARVSDDLLSIIHTKVGILEENAENGMVNPEAVEAWKGFLEHLQTQRLRQDLPAIARQLHDSDVRLRRRAAEGMAEAARHGFDVAAGAEGLRALLADEEAETRTRAAFALTRHLAASGATDALRELIESSDPARQDGAIESLAYAARDGMDVTALVPALDGLLGHARPEVRRFTALAVAMAGAHGRDVAPALPRLAGLLGDAELVVRRAAAIGFIRLAQRGVDVSLAAPGLEALRNDPDEETAHMAATALAAINTPS